MEKNKGEQFLSVRFTISSSSERQLGKRLIWTTVSKEAGSQARGTIR